ncbi:Nnf1-domain-containing protein [Parachaetomium inaequale]|uniref:Nnf1-domain-containing protein n=1 Tax=Parachaetomium inaequale TaxID=2588326 RepID=A0AAN6P585_9PEZI|nr:Nnf1-domain-containing protein [Parachaetomium inaequale]
MPTDRQAPPPAAQPHDADTEMADQPPQAPPPTAAPTPAPQPSPEETEQASPSPDGPPTQEGQGKDQEQQQQQTKQPAPIPPPPPPPGPRAARLQALFASTAKHTLDKINKDNFGACFPTISSKAPGTLEFVQRQMVERLGGLWNREFETIMANRQVVARLNELEDLVNDAARRRMESDHPNSPPVAPHTLPAATILHAHLTPHLATHQSQLNAKLQNTQAANAQLWAEIQAQRAEMEALLAGVEKAVRDMDGASGLLGGGVADELAAETRAAEGDVRAVSGR